ncbi:probable RNA-directed DNA polymerase from transposon X-element [Trichonephila clavipes]|uniref:Probable RNA-directed DNA polymerase from transposon X-element n=1 Tax=Trichonephila clavipes TaxID=2585209 RepID=A0A8X6SK99_TRICX|nr:probable RNA-directed DNA polymerase from transposon X-element [Trichonephila clavipes]
MDELTSYIADEDPDVVALQETFLRPSDDLNLANYSTHRCDRLTHRGGGTAVLVKKSIPHHGIKINTSTVESTTIVIESQPNNITICSLYNPPRSAVGNLGPDLLKIFRNRPQCIIVGDFNAKHTSWSATPHNNSAGNTIVRLVRANGFLLTAPNGPTRVHTRGRPSTIDFGITCGINNITAEVHSDLSSDHNPVHFVISINSSIPFKQNCKTLTNWYKFQSIIATSLPGNPQISDNEEIEEAIVNFNTHIHNAINQASKFKPILHSISNIPFQTRLKIREKNRLRKLWQRTQYPPLKAEVNRLQRIIRTELKNSKEHVWDSLQKDANIDTDTLHKLVAGNNSNNNIIYPPILSSRGLVFGTKEKADCFVDNLEESFTENRTPYDDDHIDKVDRTIRRFLNNYSSSIPPLTSPQEICDIISKLNIRKAPGHDQIKNIALNLYTYDFPTSPTVEVCLFADDAAILSQARSPEIFTHTEKKRPPGVGSLNIGSPLYYNLVLLLTSQAMTYLSVGNVDPLKWVSQNSTLEQSSLLFKGAREEETTWGPSSFFLIQKISVRTRGRKVASSSPVATEDLPYKWVRGSVSTFCCGVVGKGLLAQVSSTSLDQGSKLEIRNNSPSSTTLI